MDDGLIISQNKLIDVSNSQLFCSYNVLSKLLDSFGLVIEHSKTKVFHFNRLHGIFNSSQLDLSSIGGPILCSKESWKYLGFIFNRKLTFHQHIGHYSNKAISLVKYMKLLENSTREINPIQKQMLCPSYCAIWFPTLVLQQSSFFIPHENFGENAKKSSHLDFRNIQNFTY